MKHANLEQNEKAGNMLSIYFTINRIELKKGGQNLMFGRVIQRLCLVSFLGFTGFALAQQPQKPDFSGTWKFNAEKSKLQIPAPSSSTFMVDHKEPKFHLTRTHVYDGKPDTWSIDLTTDGKEVVQQEADRTLHARLYWEGNELVFDSKIVLKDREATNVVKYQLSLDGKTFTASESFRGPRLKYDNIWVFDKESPEK
jgi:hypothetical protein